MASQEVIKLRACNKFLTLDNAALRKQIKSLREDVEKLALELHFASRDRNQRENAKLNK